MENPYGYHSKEWWEFEAKVRGFRSPQEMAQHDYNNAARCPRCGAKEGFSFGTGDCGCGDD